MQWPTKWIGKSRVWINGEEAPQPTSSSTWDLPGRAIQRWGAVRACAEQPRRGEGATLASLLVFHANLSTPEVNYFCGDGCTRARPAQMPPSRQTAAAGAAQQNPAPVASDPRKLESQQDVAIRAPKTVQDGPPRASVRRTQSTWIARAPPRVAVVREPDGSCSSAMCISWQRASQAAKA